jgi:hypothetical protein
MTPDQHSAATSEPDGPSLPEILCELYDVLSAPRRCYAIRTLAASDGELTLSTLAKRIAAIEQDTKPDRATGEPYRNVYTALDQSHLPRLSDLGIVAYDDDRKIIEPGLRLGDALLLLELTQLTYRHLR